jgi:hypothetical protein
MELIDKSPLPNGTEVLIFQFVFFESFTLTITKCCQHLLNWHSTCCLWFFKIWFNECEHMAFYLIRSMPYINSFSFGIFVGVKVSIQFPYQFYALQPHTDTRLRSVVTKGSKESSPIQNDTCILLGPCKALARIAIFKDPEFVYICRRQ